MKRAYASFVVLVLAVLLSAIWAIAPGEARAQDAPRKRILFLCSYHEGDPWTDRIVEGFRGGFESTSNVEVFIEYLDARRRVPSRTAIGLRALLAAKYGDLQPDILACADDPAFDFLLENREELFPGRPIVFCGLNDFTEARRKGQKNITGVNEAPDFKGTIELLMRLQPGVRELVAITSDRLSTYRANEDRLLRAMQELGTPLKLRVLRDVTTEQIRQALRLLGPDTAVMRTSTLLRDDGQEYPFFESGRLLAAASPVPIYILWDFDLGIGAVGGSIVSGRRQGSAAAELALRVLAGEDADAIPVADSPNATILEWPGLVRFGLDPMLAPKDAQIVGRPQSDWDKYRPWLIGTASFLVLETILVAFLIASIMRRKRAERALMASETRFRTIFDSVGDAIFIHDAATGEILDVNMRMTQMYGYSRDEARTLTVAALSAGESPWSQGEALEMLRKADTEGPQVFDWLAKDCDGNQFWVEVGMRAAQLDGEDRILVTVRDIADRKRAEHALAELNRDLERMVGERTEQLRLKAEELEAANQRLLELDQLKSAFLASVSHELRTPLTSILGFAKVTARDFTRHFRPYAGGAPEVEERAERINANLAIIQREGDRLTRLINDFLDLTRIEAGKSEWADREIDTSTVIHLAAEGARGFFADLEGVRYQVKVEEGLPRLVMDPDRLEQVVGNIVSNAAKFTQEGKVVLRASRTPEDAVRIEVEDTGCGISAKELGRIFDKFHQVQGGDTTTDKPKGTGLGLAICRHIVSHYGGTIRAESDAGSGCRIIVELPAPS